MTKTVLATTLVVILAGAVIWLVAAKSHGGPVALTSPSPSASMSPMASSSVTPTSMNDIRTLQGGLKVQDLVVGSGAEAVKGSTITVLYTGMLLDGTVFDASSKHGNQPFQFTLGAGKVIQGWDIGVVGMKVGGKRRLTIPPSLAYGASGVGGVIPPNATLTFEVQLLGVLK